MVLRAPIFVFFFFNDTATTEIYTLSLHDALPISRGAQLRIRSSTLGAGSKSSTAIVTLSPASIVPSRMPGCPPDRKSTRLNSSHGYISYAVFCLKKKQAALLPCPCQQHRVSPCTG